MPEFPPKRVPRVVGTLDYHLTDRRNSSAQLRRDAVSGQVVGGGHTLTVMVSGQWSLASVCSMPIVA
jgi:hypothetical protein